MNVGSVTFECLKRRQPGIFRTVPIPPSLAQDLNERFSLNEAQKMHGAGARLWPWSRMTAYRKVCKVMKAANIYGTQASPKGLRHAFAVAAISEGIPLPLIQRWMGHADVNTTAIYMEIIGEEELSMAQILWRSTESLHIVDASIKESLFHHFDRYIYKNDQSNAIQLHFNSYSSAKTIDSPNNLIQISRASLDLHRAPSIGAVAESPS